MRVIPILPSKLEDDIFKAITMFSKKIEWRNYGLDKLREQGAALLFHGLPGTGKTITARYICSKLRYTMHEMDFGDIGSDTPGELARNIRKLFSQASVHDVRGNPSFIFLDECDTLLVSRQRLGHRTIWMLEPINALLRAIGTYKGLIVLATNQQPDFLDPALERRLLGSFEFPRPDFETRRSLWESKWPKKLPLQLDEEHCDTLSCYPMTGAEIENAIINWASHCMKEEIDFNFADLRMHLDEKYPQMINRVEINLNAGTGFPLSDDAPLDRLAQ